MLAGLIAITRREDKISAITVVFEQPTGRANSQMSDQQANRSLRLLLVEDSLPDAELVVAAFTKAGHDVDHRRVDTAEGYRKALAAERWDAIICDYSMPAFDGAAALEILNATKLDIPFIVLSGMLGEELAVEMMRHGANDYLIKNSLNRLIPATLREIKSAELRHNRHRESQQKERADAALRESEARFRLLIEHAAEAIVLFDLEAGHFTQVNPAAERMFKLSSDELCRLSPAALSPEFQPDGLPSAAKAQQYLERTAAGEMPLFFWMHRDSKDNPVPCEIRLLRIEMSGRTVIRGSITDITERRAANEALRISEAKYRQLVESSPFCIHEIDLEFKMRSINGAGLLMLGQMSDKTVIGRDYLDYVPAGEHDRIRSRLDSARSGRTVTYQWRIDSGKIFTSTAKPMVNDTGIVSGLIGITQDITEQERSRERLLLGQFMLDHISEAVFLISEDGAIRDANPAATRMLGWTREEILRRHVWEINALYTENDWPQLRDALAARGSMTRETLHRRKDGSVFEVEVNSNLFTYGGHDYHVTTVRDISERKQAEISMRDSEERFRTLATNAPVGIFQTDRDGRCIYVNSTWCRLAGMPPQEALGDGWKLAIHPQDRARAGKLWDACFSRSENCRMDYRLLSPDGSIHWVAADAVPLPGPKGHRGYIGTVMDITERQAAQEALQSSEERYSMVTRATNDGIWDIDLKTGIIWWSDTYDQLWGKRPPESRESPQWWFDHIHPEDVERVRSSFQKALAGSGDVWHCSYQYRRTSGDYANVLDRAYITRDDSGKATRILGAMADITELKHRELQLANLARRMESIREDERKHISREIHDHLGQVMTVLKMNLIQIEDDVLTLPASDSRNRLEEDIVGATEMIDQSIGAIRDIVMRIRPSVLDQLGLPAALQQEVEQFQDRSQIPCRLEVEADLPELNDDAQTTLFRLTQEFLTNISRHAGADQVEVRLDTNDDHIRLQIKDDGIGFDEKAARKRGHLGLVGARERVDSFKGNLELITAPNRGTLVVVTIPAYRAAMGKNDKNPDS